jgi:SSS family solute:Na+ symporter
VLVRPQVVWTWIAVMIWTQFWTMNNMESATMYLMAKSDRDARRMLLIPIIGTIVGPLIWFIPPMVATITHPHLGLQFPNLKNPQEAAFVAVCMDVMPKGLLGLLLCAMLGATITSMDAGLNKGAGVFVRSFYLPVIDPKCSEKRLLVVSKICSLVFGVIIVSAAVELNRLRTLELFDLTNQLATSLAAPLAVPLLWGLFYKRTPPWSALSTVAVGFAFSWFVNSHADPVALQHFLGWAKPLSKDEATDMLLAETLVLLYQPVLREEFERVQRACRGAVHAACDTDWLVRAARQCRRPAGRNGLSFDWKSVPGVRRIHFSVDLDPQ